MSDRQDSQRWLYVHEAEVVGASRSAAVELIQKAGLVSRVARYRGRPYEAPEQHQDRISLFIGDDGKVRTAESG